MSYQVIARKYRPQRFSDVVGQNHVAQTLVNAIQQNRIAHAYLFCGPRGTGKTTIARIFAKCLNCTGGPKVDFDDADPRCQEIAEGRSLDVLEIDGASNRGIEEMRELRETVRYAPATAKFKIYIIDEVHMLTKEAFNALLKTLEEPPAHVKFMFATTEPEKVLPTILSRCLRFDLRRIPAALIVAHLAQISKAEQVSIDEPALYAIARGADGAMRDAESTLDQLISFCGAKIVEEDVLSMFGLAGRDQLLALTRAMLAGEVESTLRQFNLIAKSGKDLSRLVADLLNHFRNLLLFKVSGGDLNLLEISEAEAAALLEQSASISSESLTRIMEVFADCESRLRDAASKRILLEVSLLKAIEARTAVSIDTVLDQLRHLRNGSVSNTPSSSPTRSARLIDLPSPSLAASPAISREQGETENLDVLSPAETPLSPSIRPGESAERSQNPLAAVSEAAARNSQSAEECANLEQLWIQIIEAVGRASAFTRTYLLEAHPVSFAKKVFTIGFDPEFADHLGLVDNSKNRTLIQSKLQELGHADVQVKFVQAEAPADRVRPSFEVPAGTQPASGGQVAASTDKNQLAQKSAAVTFDKDDFSNDPLIKQALELFKGQIVDIRA
jgi:DNA polymerase-3 subunit gamma/tau